MTIIRKRHHGVKKLRGAVFYLWLIDVFEL